MLSVSGFLHWNIEEDSESKEDDDSQTNESDSSLDEIMQLNEDSEDS
jgi:hypothetical protein